MDCPYKGETYYCNAGKKLRVCDQSFQNQSKRDRHVLSCHQRHKGEKRKIDDGFNVQTPEWKKRKIEEIKRIGKINNFQDYKSFNLELKNQVDVPGTFLEKEIQVTPEIDIYNEHVKLIKSYEQLKKAYSRVKETVETLKGQNAFAEAVFDNLIDFISELPTLSPYRKPLLATLFQNINDRKQFCTRILTKIGLSATYVKKINDLEKVDTSIFDLKYKPDVNRERFPDESYVAFAQLLDDVIPFDSGRRYRIRDKKKEDVWKEYVRQSKEDYPMVPTFGYTKFWFEFALRGENLRKKKLNDACPGCSLIKKGESGEFLTDKEFRKYSYLKIHHIKEVKDQYRYYKDKKRRIFRYKLTDECVIVHDFSKHEHQKSDTCQVLHITVFYYDPNSPNVLSYRYFNIPGDIKVKNDKWFVFYGWFQLMKKEFFIPFKKIWLFSDGARKHFKQIFTLSFFGSLGKKFNVEIEYNFLKSNHCNNCCDGQAEHCKRHVYWWRAEHPGERIGDKVKLCSIFNEITNHFAFPLVDYVRPTVAPKIKSVDGISKMHQVVYRNLPSENDNIQRMKFRALSKERGGFDLVKEFTQAEVMELERIISQIEETVNNAMDIDDD